MEASFELNRSTDDQYRFAFKSADGKVLLTSELYRSKRSAEDGIASVRTNGAVDGRYEKKLATNGKHYVNLKAANGQVIATSPMQASAESLDALIASVKASAANAPLQDSSSTAAG